MPALPFSFAPALWLLVVGAVLGGALWLVDIIGDRREAKVWGKINAAIERTNVDVRELNDLDAKIAAVAEDARQKALSNARAVTGQCPATPEQAKALSRIR